MIILGEVISTGDLSYDKNPKDDEDLIRPLGTIFVKLISHHPNTNSIKVYAQPFTHNSTMVPLNGETVMLVKGPSADYRGMSVSYTDYYYMPFPVNVSDDSVINQIQELNYTETNNLSGGGSRKPTRPGNTFPYPVRPISPLQPYEGDYILQNRSGAAIRLGSSTRDNSQYQHSPTFHKKGKQGDPYFVMSLYEAGSPKLRPGVDTPSNESTLYPRKKLKSQEYRIESPSTGKTAIYAGISQRFDGLQLGNARNADTRTISSYSNPQIILDSDRIVLNAKKDKLFLLSSDKATIEASSLRITTDEHSVDFDDLVKRVQDLAKELNNLTSGTSFFSTSFGPTGPATNLAQVLRIYLLTQRFKLFANIPPFNLPSFSLPPNYNFGVNTITPDAVDQKLKGESSGGSGGISTAQSSIQAAQSSIGQDLNTNFSPDIINNPPSITAQDLNIIQEQYDILKEIIENYDSGLPKLGGVGTKIDAGGEILVEPGTGVSFSNPNTPIPDYPSNTDVIPTGSGENAPEEETPIVKVNEECLGNVYKLHIDIFDTSLGTTRVIVKIAIYFSGLNNICNGWYISSEVDIEGEYVKLKEDCRIAPNFLSEPSCLADKLKSECSKSDVILSARLQNTGKTIKKQ